MTPSIACIGFFDGVHLGHQYLLSHLCRLAEARGERPLAVTFSHHPREVLQADFRPELLTSLEEKIALIKALGIEDVMVLDFTPTLARLTARTFMEQVLLPEGARALLMGYDHRFGADRADFARCHETGAALGLEVLQAEAFSEAGETVSSSEIRALLRGGEVEKAAQHLGRYYGLSGTVVEGRHVGSTLGFPTANLRPDAADKLLPASGAYAVWAETGGQRYPAMTNIGVRPTLRNGADVTIETHLFGLSRSLYGQPLSLQFVSRLRAERSFESLDALRHQLDADGREALRLLNCQNFL